MYVLPWFGFLLHYSQYIFFAATIVGLLPYLIIFMKKEDERIPLID
jgi:hypothetical protein